MNSINNQTSSTSQVRRSIVTTSAEKVLIVSTGFNEPESLAVIGRFAC